MRYTSTNSDYLSGAKLIGDDYTEEELRAWFDDEAEGFATIWSQHLKNHEYEFAALNTLHGFRWLPAQRFGHVCSLGGADGKELMPLASVIDQVTIIEPSSAFTDSSAGMPVTYLPPHPSGILPVEDTTFDLVLSFGTLHHIANVSFVMGELARCLVPGGWMLIREPIVSMGDWSEPRGRLTRRERGIPLPIFRQVIRDNLLTIRRETLCMFPLIPRLRAVLGDDVYNSSLAVRADAILSRAFSLNYRYHATATWQKLRPTCIFYVIQKPIA